MRQIKNLPNHFEVDYSPAGVKITAWDETAEGEYVNERSIPVTTKREVCWACDGRGVTTEHVECDGGGFTGSEWAEMDQDFREDYMGGLYDRACPDCNGERVIDAPDEDRMSEEAIAILEQWNRWEAQSYAEDRAERLAGC